MKKQKKPPTRKHKEKLEWIGHLSDADEVDIDNTIEDWAAHIRGKGGWEPGRWRKTTTLSSPQIQLTAKDPRKKTGVLHLRERRHWSLYYYKGDGPTIETLVESVEKHPLFGIGKWEKKKEEGHWEGGKWIWHDHLSTTDYSVRTRCNFSLTMGHTKNGDGAPERDGRQMTHAWMKILGREIISGDSENLQIVANLLCELVGFDFPYPNFFAIKA